MADSSIQPYTEAGRLAGARICHFHTGSAQLLQGHKDWITQYFIPKIRQNPGAWVDFVGSASPLGNAEVNRALSFKRIQAVESFIKGQYPDLKVNVRLANGAQDAEDFQTPAKNNDGYWRAVLMKWYGVPLKIDTPVYPPEPPPQIKYRKMMAPKGCWCVIGVDTFGIPIKAGVSGGKAELTLLNDQGEKWILRGYGLGAGLGVDVGEKHVEGALKTFLEWLKAVGLKSGDIPNVSKTVKDLNIVGPSETSGGVFKGLKWEANLSIEQITSSGFFTIFAGGFHLLVAGGETGVISFGIPPQVPVAGVISMVSSPWAFYGQAGLGTWKAAAEVGVTIYKITSKEKDSSSV